MLQAHKMLVDRERQLALVQLGEGCSSGSGGGSGSSSCALAAAAAGCSTGSSTGAGGCCCHSVGDVMSCSRKGSDSCRAPGQVTILSMNAIPETLESFFIVITTQDYPRLPNTTQYYLILLFYYITTY